MVCGCVLVEAHNRRPPLHDSVQPLVIVLDSRALAELRRASAVTVSGRRIQLINLAALEAAAGSGTDLGHNARVYPRATRFD